ncbi:MAG: efflux RND transporter periplasmic adaptor subunit [Syntrophomonadaceae bacterium]|nr:efflux RND transporter periplasmic adaptor subunit [Syntrophomonadaceae bacterium]
MKHRIKLIGLMLVITMISTLSLGGCGKTEEKVQESELTVKVAKAQIRAIAKTSQYSGSIRGINEVNVMPKAVARVTSINVKPGDNVKKDQVLITLDSSDYQAGIRQAEAALAMAEAGKRANDVQKTAAQANYERILMLHEGGGVSDSQLEAAKAQYDALNSGSAEAAVEQARAALQQATNNIGNCTISAPISGVVGSIGLSMGEMASMQSPAAIISDTSRLEVEVQVSESEISYVQEGSEVEVRVGAVREDPFKGIVDSVSVAADPSSKNYKVKITLDNPDRMIKSGMFAQVALSTVAEPQALCVPRNAVIPKGSLSVVYIVDEDSRARMQEVETGIENSKYIQISKGLKEGQEVIEKGNTLVSDGSKVRVVAGGEK